MTQIPEAMSGPVVAVDQSATTADAAKLMRQNNTGDVVVTVNDSSASSPTGIWLSG
jgi:CBS domain-containing protein